MGGGRGYMVGSRGGERWVVWWEAGVVRYGLYGACEGQRRVW
jgi:hypothetical protein